MKRFFSSALVLLAMLACVTQAYGQDVVTYYHTDNVGSPIAATDQNGNTVWTEEYTPYGERWTTDINSVSNRQWFTGHTADKETNLVYAGARYYDPAIGRFLGVDRVGVAPNQFSFNRYAYGNNNPYRYVDPDGTTARVIVDRQALSITVKTPFTPLNIGIPGSRISQAVSKISQTVVDRGGRKWTVTFVPVAGQLVHEDGRTFTNFIYTDRDLRPVGFGLSQKRTDGLIREVRMHPDTPLKTIAHEVGGHGAELNDEYDQKTRSSNPALPHNLMNNDDSSEQGLQLNWQQVEFMMSVESGNQIVEGKESILMKLRDQLR